MENKEMFQKTLLDIKNMYGSKIIRYRHQRPLVSDHATELKEYIETTYNKDEFYLPPIVLVPNDNDQYEIIDGIHRCVAIAEKINEKHPCMNTHIYVIYKNIQANTHAAMKLFMNINKARPMPRLYFEENYIKKIYKNTETSIKYIYGSSIINDKENCTKCDISSKLNYYKLDEIINTNNIELLIINNDITGLDNNEIFKLIQKTNNSIIEKINFHMQIDVFNTFDSLTNNHKIKLVNFINKVLITHNAECNVLQANTILRIIKLIIDRWKEVKKNLQNKKKVNILTFKPMVLGLFPKIPILELEQVFINTKLFDIQNNDLEGEYERESEGEQEPGY
jgi:hypothetical protein